MRIVIKVTWANEELFHFRSPDSSSLKLHHCIMSRNLVSLHCYMLQNIQFYQMKMLKMDASVKPLHTRGFTIKIM
jgi:hypothetical protein